MESEQKDFKAVKVQMKSAQKQGETLSRSMLYSGINIFGQLSRAYMASKDQFQQTYQMPINQQSFSTGTSTTDSSMMHLSQEVLAVFKRMQKKDSTTKIKAFQELDKFVDEIDKDSEELTHILTFFLYHFCRVILNESDKKVREAAHSSFSAFIKKDKRKLGPHLKKVFSLWYCSFFDPSHEVASVAQKNFEQAFPKGKRDEVFKIAYKNFLHFTNEQLRQSEDQMADQSGDMSKQQREDVFDRVTSSVLIGLAYSFDFISEWKEEDKAHYKKKLIDILDLSHEVKDQEPKEEEKKQKKKASQPQSYLWTFLQPKYRGRVRSSCLSFISNFLANIPADVIEQHISFIAPMVYNLVGENNSNLQQTLWKEALFQLAKTYPSSWSLINIKKDFIPKLYNSLKNAGYGAPTSLYENFIKYVSVNPLYQLTDYQEDKVNKASLKERGNLLREVFTNLYAGLKNEEAVAFHQELTKCYYETLAFVILKRVQPLIQKNGLEHEDSQFVMTQIKKCIQAPISDYLNNYERGMSKVQNQRNIRVTIPSQNHRLLANLSERDVDKGIFEQIIGYIFEELTTQEVLYQKPNTVRVISKLITTLPNQELDELLSESLIHKYFRSSLDLLEKSINDLSRANVQLIIDRAFNLLKIIYRINKFKQTYKSIDIDKLIELLSSVIKKEELSKNALNQDDLKKFNIIKVTLIDGIILVINQDSVVQKETKQFIQLMVSSINLDIKQKVKLLLPQQDFSKVQFNQYFEHLNKHAHQEIMDFICKDIIQNDKQIHAYHSIINKGIKDLLSDKPSFFIKEDLLHIQSLVEQKVKSTNNGLLLSSYFNAISHILITSKEKDIEELRLTLFDKLLQLRITDPGHKELWKTFEQVLKQCLKDKNEEYFTTCQKKLQEYFMKVVASNSNYEVETFNRFTHIVKEFVQLCPNKQQVIQSIILQESNFENIEKNSMPMKMFRDLFLSGGVGFDITQLFQKQGSEQYVWLAASLIHSKYMSSISSYIQLKRQLMIFMETELFPTLINQALEGNSSLVMSIAKYMIQKNNETKGSWTYSIQYLVKKLIDPGEAYPSDQKPVLKINQLLELLEIIGANSRNKIMQEGQVEDNEETQLFLMTLSEVAYYVIDEEKYQQLFKRSEEYLGKTLDGKQQIDHMFGIHIEVYVSLVGYLSQDLQLAQNLIVFIHKNKNKILDDQQLISSCLSFMSFLLNKEGLNNFKQMLKDQDFESFINSVFEAQNKMHIPPLTFIQFFTLIRKTMASDLIQNKANIIKQVLEIAREYSLAFDLKLQKVQENLGKEVIEVEQKEEEDLEIEDFEFEMLQDLAETILIFTSYLDNTLDENNLYFLMASGVESLQKAAYVVLKYFYENFLPHLKYPVAEDDEIKQIKEEEVNRQEQEEVKELSEEHKQKYKNKLAFRNISEILIELLENPPSIHSPTQDSQQVAIVNSQIENLIHGEQKDGCMSQRLFGYFLAWNSLLIKIENGRIKSQLEGVKDYQIVLGALNEYLEENFEIYQMLLVSLVAYLPQAKRGLAEAFNVTVFEPEYMELSDQKQNEIFCIYTLINFMKSFPSLARKYYSECDKQLVDIVMPYIKQIVSPAILENEIKKIEVAQIGLGSNELSFNLFKSTKEILANYSKGEIEMQLRIKIPTNYPLSLVEAEVTKSIKTSERQMRKWVLSIRKILQFQNGDIITAVLQWKSNIDKEIEGVEDCYICYCVVHEKDQSLPKMPCKHCKNKFHLACIRKWFRTSNKSNCPLCQNYFF